jgi:non-specific serine/threonine protein kinase
LLGVIQEFCVEQLDVLNELEAAKRRHCDYYLTLVRELAGTEMATELPRLEIELPNIRVALVWAYEGGHSETALRLAVALYSFWGYRGHLQEGQDWLLKILERGETSTRVRVDGLLAVCGSFAFQGDHGRATLACREAAELAERDRYPFGQAMAHLYRGIIADWEGKCGEAAGIYAQCSQRIGDFGGAYWQMRVLALQAEMDVLLGNVASGEQRARQAMASARESGYFWIAGSAAGVLAYLDLMRSDLAAAGQRYHENLMRYQSVGHLRGLSGALAGFAGIAAACGQMTTAARLMGAAHATLAEIGAAHLKNKGLSDRIETRVRASMPASAYRAASDAGYALGREWACAEAQAVLQNIAGKSGNDPPDAATEAGLTRREIDVLYLLARRLTDKEIAAALSISPRTAMHHVSSILAKLALSSRRQVPKWAEQHRII